jgi:hypothetical protein
VSLVRDQVGEPNLEQHHSLIGNDRAVLFWTHYQFAPADRNIFHWATNLSNDTNRRVVLYKRRIPEI